MKGSNWVLIALAIGVGWFLFSKARTITSLQFVPRDIGFGGGGLQLVLGVQNPTSTPLTLRSLIGGVYVDGNRVSDVSSFVTQVIGPNAETPLVINVTPDIFGIINSVITAINNGIPTTRTVELIATANLDNQALPVKAKFV